jgi:phytoene dehydrogenase-like protein
MTVDVVVAGAGHNSLIAAAYLTRAGHRCRVLDARAVPGGGVASEQLLRPGFLVDSCSTGHTLIQSNPLLADDELGLVSEHGLRYIAPDPVGHVVFPDGESLTMWLDLERTCEETARFSRADADSYRRRLAEYDAVKDVFLRQRFTPVGFGPSFQEMLADRLGGARWLRRAAMSAWDVIRHEFQSRHVRSFMLWMAFQTGQPVTSAGSGPLAYSIVFGRQRRSWTLPVGGSGQLARALVEVIEQGGGEVLCGREVVGLVLEDGRCVGVMTADGERHLAHEAVLSTIHVKDLVNMAPPAAWGEDFLYCVRRVRRGRSRIRRALRHDRAPAVPAAGRRRAHRGIGRPRRLAGGDRADGT